MVDDIEVGRRPIVAESADAVGSGSESFEACPGRRLKHDYDRGRTDLIAELEDAWGPVIMQWEGYASNTKLRFAGSSGGAASALSAFVMERLGFVGTLHVAARRDIPFLNETVMSTSVEALLDRTGSRYAPASPCDRLALIERAAGKCVFIGKPCDVAAAHSASKMRPNLNKNLGLTIAMFCAGTPSTRGTLEVLRTVGIDDPGKVRNIRYRGNGWPGDLKIDCDSAAGLESRSMTYEESWGKILQKHRQWRCYVCPDHTGEFADVSVGDPWYREIVPGEAGRSLILARTDRGRDIVQNAIKSGYLDATPVPANVLPASQHHLLKARANVFPRVAVTRIMGAAAPKFSGFPSFRFWWSTLSLREKLGSVVGTARRVMRKRLRVRLVVKPYLPGVTVHSRHD